MSGPSKSSSSEKLDDPAFVTVAERPVSNWEKQGDSYSPNTQDEGGLKRRRFGLKIKPQPSRFAPGSKITNRDFDPTAPSERSWSYMAFLVFWLADAWAVSMLQLGSSIAAVTLNWQNAIVAIV